MLTLFQVITAEDWGKLPINSNCASDKPHWLHCHRAKMKHAHFQTQRLSVKIAKPSDVVPTRNNLTMKKRINEDKK